MAVRALGGIARSSVSDRKVFDFAGCDLAVPVPWNMVGGGNRTRRRIHEGDVRWNWMGYGRKFEEWYPTLATVTPNDLANPFDPGTFADKIELDASANARILFDALDLIIVNGDVISIFFDTYAATAQDINIQLLTGPAYGQFSNEITFNIPAGWSRNRVTFNAVTGVTTDNYPRIYFVQRDSAGRTFWLDRFQMQKNNSAFEPYIDTPTASSASTQGLLQRTNGFTYSEGNSATLATSSNVSDGTAFLDFDNVIAFDDATVQREAYRAFAGSDGVFYTLSVFAQMYDSGLPVASGDTTNTTDFNLIFGGGTAAGSYQIEKVGPDQYRVSFGRIYVSASDNTAFGVLKRTTHSARGFRITGYQIEKGGLTQYIKTLDSPSTTTDWPRTQYLPRTTRYSDTARWTKNGVGAGTQPVIVAEGVADPSGGNGATRVTFNLNGSDTLGDVSSLQQYQPSANMVIGAQYCAGVWAKIPLGKTLVLRHVGASAYMAMVGTGNWKRYERPEIATVTLLNIEIGMRGNTGVDVTFNEPVTADLWISTLEDGPVLTSTFDNDTYERLTIVTPPFGESVEVVTGKPRIEYSSSGIGLGIRLMGEAQNLSTNSTDFQTGWQIAGVIVSPAQVPSIQGGTASLYALTANADGVVYRQYTGLTPGAVHTFSCDVVLGTAPDFCLAVNDGLAWNSVPGTRKFTESDGLSTQRPSRVSISFTAPASGIVNIHLGGHQNTVEASDQTPGTVIVSNHMLVEGRQTDYIPAGGVAVAADAESLETFDLDALGLADGHGTMYVEFTMPEIQSGALHGMLSLCTADAGVWLGVYSNGDGVYAACYSGGVRYSALFGPFAAGDVVRAAMSFGTGYFASAVNGVPGAVQYGVDPIDYDRAVIGDMDGPRNRPADTIINSAFTTGRVSVTDELCEWTQL